MKFTTQLRDAFKYTLRDWKAIVLLGIFLCMASTFEEIHSNNLLILIVAFVVCTVLLFFEEGYRYKIIKETMKGDKRGILRIYYNKRIYIDFKHIILDC